MTEFAQELRPSTGDYAVIDDGIQWILRRYQGGRWRDISFVRSTKDVLARCLREAEAPAAEANALLDGLPNQHRTWPEAGSRRLNPKTLSRAYSVAKTLPATLAPALLGARVIVGPVENYGARSLWAASLPPDLDIAAREREANNWDRIRKEIAWSKPRPPAPKEMQSDWRARSPSAPIADDLSIPDFLKRQPAAEWTQPAPPMISVLRDNHCVGFLRSAGRASRPIN